MHNDLRIWRELFLDIALRAIRRTHYEFGIWELGQSKLKLTDFLNLNQGNGINFAPEESVRDAIAQEIIYSGLWKQHPIEDEPRSYWIDREVRISYDMREALKFEIYKKYLSKKVNNNPENIFNIDIVFKRIEEKSNDNKPTIPVLIEAKRFELVTINLIDKSMKIGKPQFRDIDSDILKLKILKDIYKDKEITIKDKQYKGFQTYILVWGLSRKRFDIKKDLINKLDGKKYLSKKETSIRYLPIQWNEKLKVTKSYVCKNAINNSKIETTKIIPTGKINNNPHAAVKLKAPNPKLAKIFNNACPEVMFANNRTAKLIIREILEIISITIIKGVIANGEPLGKKWFNIVILLS